MIRLSRDPNIRNTSARRSGCDDFDPDQGDLDQYPYFQILQEPPYGMVKDLPKYLSCDILRDIKNYLWFISCLRPIHYVNLLADMITNPVWILPAHGRISIFSGGRRKPVKKYLSRSVKKKLKFYN